MKRHVRRQKEKKRKWKKKGKCGNAIKREQYIKKEKGS